MQALLADLLGDELKHEFPNGGLRKLLSSHLNEAESSALLSMPVPLWLKTFAIWLAISPFKLRNFTREAVPEHFCGPSDSTVRLRWLDTESVSEESKFGSFDNSYLSQSRSRKDTFFISPDGYMGLGPHGMRAGDVICCVPGCTYPLTIRPVVKTDELVGDLAEGGEHYKLLGACYIYGMMKREIAADPKSCEKVQRIVLV